MYLIVFTYDANDSNDIPGVRIFLLVFSRSLRLVSTSIKRREEGCEVSKQGHETPQISRALYFLTDTKYIMYMIYVYNIYIYTYT